MAVTASQEAAFTSATLGVTMTNFSTTILLVFYSVLYVWVAWVMVTQWQAWSQQRIDFYDFLIRAVRSIVLTLVLGFLVH